MGSLPVSRDSWETTEAVAKACSTHQSSATGVLFILFLQSFAGPRGGARTKIVLREYRGVPGTALQAGVGLGSSPTLTKWSFEPDTATGGARRRSILKKEGRGVEYSSESLNISSIEQGIVVQYCRRKDAASINVFSSVSSREASTSICKSAHSARKRSV